MIPEATPDNLSRLIDQNRWLAVSALVIGFIVRTLKNDDFILSRWVSIPSQYRPALAIVLGAVAGAMYSVSEGRPVKQSVMEGIISGTLAIMGDTVFVQALRGGRDVGVPK